MARKLVIVESPAKARTISGYLGADYDVEASVGHIRDLPQPSELPADMKKGPFGKFAVNVDEGFQFHHARTEVHFGAALTGRSSRLHGRHRNAAVEQGESEKR